MPEKIGKFEVLRVLGRGGMGVVYLASDPAIGRQVALKVIDPSLADDPGLRERFQREARAAGNLHHPNIVTIYEFGEHAGAPFLAMEYVAGEALDRLLGRAGMSTEQKLRLFVQVCDALDFAHRAGVVHRDVKPGNVIVQANGTAKLVDFGIARMGAGSTRRSVIVGTIAYVSPEQVRGDDLDHRSDIFSAGVMLYELLSARLPFEGKSTAETLRKIAEAAPPPLVVAGVIAPEAVAKIVGKALEKEPERRQQSAAELGNEVRRYLGMPAAEPAPELPPTLVRQENGTAAAPTRARSVDEPKTSPGGAARQTWKRGAVRGVGVALALVALVLLGRVAATELPLQKELPYLWLRTKAALGSGDASYRLGDMYERDAEIHRHVSDDPQAVAWMRAAAEKGDARAQYVYGLWLVGGRYTTKDAAAGTEWLRRAAEQSYAPAQYSYAHQLADSGAADESRAWLRRAAESGSPEAMQELAYSLLSTGKAEDLRSAADWFEKAAVAAPERAAGLRNAAREAREALTRKFTVIEGTIPVEAPDGSPLALEALLLKSDGNSVYGTVKPGGRFQFDDVPVGNHTLRLYVGGEPYECKANVHFGTRWQMTFPASPAEYRANGTGGLLPCPVPRANTSTSSDRSDFERQRIRFN